MAQVLPAFEAWMDAQGIERSPAIQLVAAAAGCSGLALGVQAARDIAEGERLCTIPKAACLSIRTSQLADVIEAEELGGGLGLVLAVLHEMSLGEESKWHGYFAACPRREYLPLFWTDTQLALLQGTELDGNVQLDREAAREDFEEHVLPLLQKYPGRLRPAFITLPNFHAAASLVASRAFGVDDWHGDAMVPLADIFNHKASVVELAPGYEVHGADSDSDVEDNSGSEGGSGSEGRSEGGSGGESGSEEEAGSSSNGEEEDEQEGGRGSGGHHQHHHHGSCGAGCSHEHGSHAHGGGEGQPDGDGQDLPSVMGSGPAKIYGLTSANGLHLRLQMGIVDRDEQTLEIVAPSEVPSGEEVHNTYGELGNAELVKKYGFALRQNPFTSVGLDKARLLGAARRALGGARWRARSKLLRDQTEVLEDEEEPFEALPNGHISPALFVALRVLCAPDAEASGWSGIADALQPPEAAASGAAEDSQQQELGAVQVWPVLDADGHPLAADAAAAAGSGEQQQGSYTALLSRGMCELLQEEVRQRLGAYACSLEEDLEQLRQAGTPAAAGPGAGSQAEAEEQRVAEQAALLLRVTEKEVLHGLLAALERRLAVLPAADGKTAASGKAAAGAKRKAAPAPAPGKQKAAQRGSRRRQ